MTIKNQPITINSFRLIKFILILGLFLAAPSFFGQTFSEDDKISHSDRKGLDVFGVSVAISGNFAIVGSRNKRDENGDNLLIKAGAAYIFERDENGDWNEIQKIVASDRAEEDYFGQAVAIDGDIAIVTAIFEDEDVEGNNPLSAAGSAYIFERNELGVWIEVQKIVALDRGAEDEFGTSVSISGNTAVIGARFEDHNATGTGPASNSGSAYIFDRDVDGQWSQTQKIVATNRYVNQQAGTSVSISGDHCVIGAPENVGAAFIFERGTDGTWTETQELSATGIIDTSFNGFGYSVAVSDNNILVGIPYTLYYFDTVPGYLPSAGAVSVYEQTDAGDWIEVQILRSSIIEDRDFFGYSIAVSDGVAVVGSPNHDSVNPNTGSVTKFEKNEDGSWEVTQRLEQSEALSGDNLGRSVATSAGISIVGCPSHDRDENGENHLVGAGAAYLYEEGVVLSIDPIDDEVSIDLSIAPNPNTGIFSVNTSAIGGMISIFSIDGKEIRSKRKILSKSEPIDLSNQPSGIYFLTISYSGMIHTEKIVLQ